MGFDDAALADHAVTASVPAAVKGALILPAAAPESGARCAPSGDYLMTRAAGGTLRITSVTTGDAYLLSVDAVAQHVFEGRLDLFGALPGPGRE